MRDESGLSAVELVIIVAGVLLIIFLASKIF